jgi:3-oxoacyl-(acyl-carrier-protein) synthase
VDIVITGEGIVSAIGNDKASVLQALREGRSGIAEMQYLQSSHHELPVGEVKLSNDEMKAMLDIEPMEEISRNTLLGILAVKQALEESGVSSAEGKRIVLISGTTVGGMDITEQHFDSFTTTDERPDCLLKHDCGSSTQEIAAYFGIFKESTTISTACSSAANALILGARLLKAGQADMVVAGGTEALTRFHLNGFNSLMILDHEPCRPFDDERAGLNLGEGAGFVVMETEASAQTRGAEIHGWLAGYGNACDAFHQTASSDDGEGAYLAMKEALEMAHLRPQDIDYVNAHGTGTPNNDLSESAALKRIFGDHLPRISSTKGFTGHTTSASGSIETVICLLAMRHHFVPANMGWKHQMEEGITPSVGETDCELKYVLCNAFGFGGNDSALILTGGRAESRGQTPCAPQATHAGVSPHDSATHAGVSPHDSAVDAGVSPHDSAVDAGGGRQDAVQVVAAVEVTREEELAEIKNYVKPLEARRMGKMMKSSLLASLKALEQAGIERPDAIVTATSLGCLENTELLLLQLREEGEVMLKPTYFMQSTHNTISSHIAIRTKCHGYNITYSHGAESLEWAIRDAHLLLRSGKAGSVLVGLHDETTPLYREQMEKLGVKDLNPIYSKVMILTCGR